MNPLRDSLTLIDLARIFRSFKADCVLVYAAKPVIYGSLAARITRVPLRSAMITGIGSALGGTGGWRRRLLSFVMRGLYRLSLRNVHMVFFQNPDDRDLFGRLRLLRPSIATRLIAGSGVNLDRFAPAPWPEGPPTFIMVGRVIRDKGIYEYVEAARRVRRLAPEVRIRLLGPLDSNPSAVTQEQLDAWRAEGVIDYLGSTDDVRPYLSDAHVCVLPSYGEGMPRSVLEAMAMGRPVLVTDVPGCRETVVDGTNGRLVPVRDPIALADAMLDMIRDDSRLQEMGRMSRLRAETRFDVRQVNETILHALGAA